MTPVILHTSFLFRVIFNFRQFIFSKEISDPVSNKKLHTLFEIFKDIFTKFVDGFEKLKTFIDFFSPSPRGLVRFPKL